MTSDEQNYEELLYDYRKIWEAERRADLHADRAERQFYFVERNRIHEQLRGIASRMGKSPADITVDLLASEDSLREYKLPEFRMLRTRDAFPKAVEMIIWSENGQREIGRTKDVSERDAVFIPFGQRESWHLFDCETYDFRRPDDTDRHRRARRVVELAGGMAREAELRSVETFHNATTLFGIVCSAEDVERVLRAMEKNRSEISIDTRFMDETRVREDFREIIRQDLDYIFSKEHDEGEDSLYLVKRLQDYVRDYARLPPVFVEDAMLLLEEAVLRAEREGRELDLERAGEESVRGLDDAEEKYPVESSMAKRGGMKRV